MPWTDVSRVTTAITHLIKQVIDERDAPSAPVEVTPAPYEEVTGVGPNVIHVHLFHMVEDPHQRNLPPVSYGKPAVQFTPLALVLNYVVTARNTTAVEVADRTLAEQRLIGLAARALHDFPVIDDSTQIGANTPILQDPLVAADAEGNVIQLILRPVTLEESINFWSTQQLVTPRLALFYEARVVVLSTPPPNSLPGIVLTVGNYVFAGGEPHLLALRSRTGFLPAPQPNAPPAPPGTVTLLASNPARVALFPAGAALPPEVVALNAELAIEGQHLTGARVLLELRGPVLVGAGPVGEQRFRIDLLNPTANPDWSFSTSGVSVRAVMRQLVHDEQGLTLTLMPGIFRARLVLSKQPPGDTTGKLQPQSTNELVFALVPQVVKVTNNGGPPSAHAFRVELFGSYLSTDLDVELAVGGSLFSFVSTSPGAGEFTFAPGSSQIDFALDISAATSPLPVRVMIGGAESTPAWAVW